MVLGFKEQFIPKILAGTKIHTVCKDESDRWGKGVIIHFSTSTRTKNYNNFKTSDCVSTQYVIIQWIEYKSSKKMTVQIDGRLLNEKEVQEFAYNDGFDRVDDFEVWFNEDFYGKIIHWTEKRY
jgi:hypothetical protein